MISLLKVALFLGLAFFLLIVFSWIRLTYEDTEAVEIDLQDIERREPEVSSTD